MSINKVKTEIQVLLDKQNKIQEKLMVKRNLLRSKEQRKRFKNFRVLGVFLWKCLMEDALIVSDDLVSRMMTRENERTRLIEALNDIHEEKQARQRKKAV